VTVGTSWPVIPVDAWRRGIGLACPNVGHPRVTTPMIDDGEWAGIPIGGLGTGSIGRTFRGDFARWHLEVGTHRFRPSSVDGFTVHVGGVAGEAPRTTLLSGLRPPDLPASIGHLAPGQGTYHALFPRAWQAFEPEDLGVRLVGEQLSPVIAGDFEASALPLGVFDWWIENPASEARTVSLLLTWEDPAASQGGATAGGSHEQRTSPPAAGVILRSPTEAPTGLQGTLAIAAQSDPGLTIRTRSGLDADALREVRVAFAEHGRLEPGVATLTGATAAALSAAIGVSAVVGPGERRAIRFSIAWDLPIVEFGSGRRWWKRYTRAWGRTGERAWDLAVHAIERADSWRAAIEAWQAPVLTDPGRPDWYKAALFNELYYLVDGGSFWEAGEVGGAVPAADDPGRFALMECFDYPFYDSVDVDFSASSAILELFPELERRGIRDLLVAVEIEDPSIVAIEATGRSATRKLAGLVPHDIGGPDEDPFERPNRYRFQDPNTWLDLAPKLVLQVLRDVKALPDPDLVRLARPTVERILEGIAAHDADGDGLPEHAGAPDQTYDTWPMVGPSAYVGILWLGALRAAEELALLDGDEVAARRWRVAYERGRSSLEKRLWLGTYFAFDAAGPTSDSVMADQLAGQWYADLSGLGDLVTPDRIGTALRTVHQRNVVDFGDGLLGAVNGMRAGGGVDRSSEQSEEVWVGTTYALAALMIGRGLLEEGWETARGAAMVTYERGLWFRTPEAYDAAGNYRPSLYVRPLAIWSIEEALRRWRRSASGVASSPPISPVRTAPG
jgi:non-lysosomal glucosylceramidase